MTHESAHNSRATATQAVDGFMMATEPACDELGQHPTLRAASDPVRSAAVTT
jgi:membrane-bound lytic murein transglycosylase MltF